MLSVFALLAQWLLLNRGVGQFSLAEWTTTSGRVSHLAIAELILYPFIGIAFLLWLHRCYVNLVELGCFSEIAAAALAYRLVSTLTARQKLRVTG